VSLQLSEIVEWVYAVQLAGVNELTGQGHDGAHTNHLAGVEMRYSFSVEIFGKEGKAPIPPRCADGSGVWILLGRRFPCMRASGSLLQGFGNRKTSSCFGSICLDLCRLTYHYGVIRFCEENSQAIALSRSGLAVPAFFK
jgi:hypothetical protein